ncbi:hypothetical protein ACLQ2J_04285 [Streptomyces cyaneofuscatus]|uniref:hypothetical protein n=1 Tax=Streptomyces cyaneofuscatus TaxID=66883 RepID=UPI003CFAF0F3
MGVAVKQSLEKLARTTWRSAYATAGSPHCRSPRDTGFGRAGCPRCTATPSTGYWSPKAQSEGMTIVTRDKWSPQYDVPVMAV